jgi:hypothetical protein
MIEDNCGGIPWSEHERAFRMGRPAASTLSDTANKNFNGVGVYGIGMKRAIFKMGSEAYIHTKHKKDSYEVTVDSDWMQSEEDWDLGVKSSKWKNNEDGTSITVNDLHDDIKSIFSADAFEDGLLERIGTHFAVIIDKGFAISVNGTLAKADPILFRLSEKQSDNSVQPYVFRALENGVEVFLSIGIREPIPGIERVIEEQEGVRYSAEYAGWTIICNDRVVLYCDRSELTGWGTAGIPRYHPQFIAISGVVEFTGDPSKLPTNTTKRGLSANSVIYQRVLDRMREGLRLFVDFTNKWKTREDDAKKIVASVPSVTLPELKRRVTDVAFKFTETRTGMRGQQYKPQLPLPKIVEKDARISFVRDIDDIKTLASYLIDDNDDIRERDIPRIVGERSFDFALKQLVKPGVKKTK